MSDYLPNLDVCALIAPHDAPRYGNNTLYSFVGGRGTDKIPRCHHGWLAILKFDETVYGCAGHIVKDLVAQPDGLACGFYMPSGDQRRLRLNSRCHHEIDWGSEIPDARLMTERAQWRLGIEGAIDRAADIYQALHDAAELKKLEQLPHTPKSGSSGLPETPRKSPSDKAPTSPITPPPRKLNREEIKRALRSPTSAKDERAALTSSSSSLTSHRPRGRGDPGPSGRT